MPRIALIGTDNVMWDKKRVYNIRGNV